MKDGNGTAAVKCQHKIKSHLKEKFRHVFEGIAKAGQPTGLNDIYTESFITERVSGEVNKEHENNQIWTDVTKSTSVDMLLTNLIRGYLLPTARIWITTRPAAANQIPAECVGMVTEVKGFTNQQKEEYFRKRFREEKLASTIISHYYSHYHNNQIMTDVTKSTSVDMLLTNLIRGYLLPTARIWITTRPAAANQIPAECVGMVTEVKGFTNQQKEEYFRKRFREEKLASTIISH
ncbi:hypothetical protein NHX12_015179, partial [Muraenolepis orangiensis]